MWKQLADLFTSVFTLTHRLERVEQGQKEQQREIKALAALVDRLAFELARTNDELRRSAEREQSEREKFVLMLDKSTAESRQAVAYAGRQTVARVCGAPYSLTAHYGDATAFPKCSHSKQSAESIW